MVLLEPTTSGERSEDPTDPPVLLDSPGSHPSKLINEKTRLQPESARRRNWNNKLQTKLLLKAAGVYVAFNANGAVEPLLRKVGYRQRGEV